MADLRVLIAAADPLARAGLSALLADVAELQVVGQGDFDDLAASVDAYRPDVLLADLGWRLDDALTALDKFVGDEPDDGLPLLALLALLADVDDAAQIFAAGARGLLPREADAETLVAALRAVAGGLVVVAPEMATALASRARVVLADDELLVESLTPRETEVLELIAEGLPNKTIARRLDISEHTVKFHVNSLLGKLGAQSRTEAVVRATRAGLILL